MSTINSLSFIKERFFPSFYTNEAPRLIEFFGYYLEWMSQEDNPYWTISKLSEFTDIDGSVEKYGKHLKNELMIDFPIDYAGDIRYIMRNLTRLYQSKGTIDSYKFFFRAMYNSFCEISYPREHILKSSDGKWTQGYYIYTSDIPEIDYGKLVGKTLIEEETGITGLVNNTVPQYLWNEESDKLELHYVLGIIDNTKNFTEGNHLRVHGSDTVFEITKITRTSGYWDGTDGLISTDKVLQDSYYYQIYSYEISSLVSVAEYKDIVQKLIHPAGLKMFGNVKLNGELEEMEKDDITFIRWWIITWLVQLLIQEKELLEHLYIIRNQPTPGQFPFTADQQYYHKQYGLVSNVSKFTPNQLKKRTNEANKILFQNGKLIGTHWGEYEIKEDEANHYDVIGIRAKHPPVYTYCQHGYILIGSDNEVSDIPFIFVNGKKIRDSQVIRVHNGFMLRDRTLTGNCVIYSLDDNTIKRVRTETLTGNEIYFAHSEKRQIIPFINGEFVWDSCTYENNILTVPYSEGVLELYEFVNNEELFAEHYGWTTADNVRRTLYHQNPLRNLLMNVTDNDYYHRNTVSYSVYQFPFTADQQYHKKQYGLVSNVSDMRPSDLHELTNSSNRMVFDAETGTVVEPNWGTYTFKDPCSHYCISGFRAGYQSIHAKCVHGIITLKDNPYIPDDVIPFIFVNGLKIADFLVERTDTGYTIKETDISGDVIIYFPKKSYISRAISQRIAHNSKMVKLDNSNLQEFIVFQNGKFVWNTIRYKRDKFWLPSSKGHYEVYEFINNEDLFVLEYLIENENNTTLYCYNPLRNILANVTKNDTYYRNTIDFSYFSVYGFPFTADQQYQKKQYGLVSNVSDMTPYDLYEITNTSNRMVFNTDTGTLIEPDWGTYTFKEPCSRYCISGFRAGYSNIHAVCKSGIIELTEIAHIPDDVHPFIFINGEKVNDDLVEKTESGYTIKGSTISGNVTIYFIKNNSIVNKISRPVINNTKLVKYDASRKQHFIIFQNGKLVWTKCRYERNKLWLPSSKGYVEIYEFVDNTDCLTVEYNLNNPNNRTLYCYNPLRNILANVTKSDTYHYNSIGYYTYKFPWTADHEYYQKTLYGTTSNVQEYTPNELLTFANISNKMTFINGKLVEPEWAVYRLPVASRKYTISGLITNKYIIRAYSDNGFIRLENEDLRWKGYLPFVFIDGKKIPDKYIVRNEDGICVATGESGRVILYFPKPDTIRRSFTYTLKNNNRIIRYPFPDKQRTIVFLNGNFVWDRTQWHKDRILLPETKGYVELYEFINNENLVTMEYDLQDDNNTRFYCYNPIRYSTFGYKNPDAYDLDSETIPEETKELNLFEHPPFINVTSSDTQFHNKDYGSIYGISDIPPVTLEHKTNASNKMVFIDQNLVIPDWKNQKLPKKSDTYYISSIRTERTRIVTKCINNRIVCNPNSIRSVPFIFVNGEKVPDAYIETTKTGYMITSDKKYNGKCVIYFPLLDIIPRSISGNIDSNTIEFSGSSKNQLLVFFNGKFIWDYTEYTNNTLKLPFLSGYLELYEFQNNESLFTVKYKVPDKNNKTLYCYNTIKAINTIAELKLNKGN